MTLRVELIDGSIYLSPASLIEANRRLKFQILGSRFGGEQIDGCAKILLSKQWENQSDCLLALRELFEKHKLAYDFDDSANPAVQEYLSEREDYEQRVHLAQNVWNGTIESEEFIEFVSVIEANFSRRLYRLQLLAGFHMAWSLHACNFSVPGAGKSSIVLASYSYHKSASNGVLKSSPLLIIVGPLSSFASWDNEWEGCFGSPGNLKRISGVSKSERDEFFENVLVRGVSALPEAILMHYQTMMTELERLKSICLVSDVMLVIDEAHYIKNTDDGMWAQAALDLAPFAKSRVLLTGTPAPNGYRDLYNLFKFLWPKENIIKYHPGQLEEMSRFQFDERRQDVQEAISRWYVRISKKHILPQEDYPIREYREIVPLSSAHEEIYLKIKNWVKESLYSANDANNSTSFFKSKVIRLRQCATSPENVLHGLQAYSEEAFLDSEEQAILDLVSNYDWKIEGKYKRLLELVSDLVRREEKVLVWCDFRFTTRKVHEFLNEQGINAITLHDPGTQLSEDALESEESLSVLLAREKAINRFRHDKSVQVLVTSPHLMAESVSLHKWCHTAIYFERNWNCAQFIQSRDRIHRVGLDMNVSTTYFYLISADTIELRVDAALQEKMNLMLDLIDSQEIPLFAEGDLDAGLEENWQQVLEEYLAS